MNTDLVVLLTTNKHFVFIKDIGPYIPIFCITLTCSREHICIGCPMESYRYSAFKPRHDLTLQNINPCSMDPIYTSSPIDSIGTGSIQLKNIYLGIALLYTILISTLWYLCVLVHSLTPMCTVNLSCKKYYSNYGFIVQNTDPCPIKYSFTSLQLTSICNSILK